MIDVYILKDIIGDHNLCETQKETLQKLIDKIERREMIELKELKKAFWQYIGKHGIVITNGNIDFVVEDCLKELQNG